MVSDFSKFHMELEKLKEILAKNAYPHKFIDKCTYKFLNRIFEHKPKDTTVPQKKLKIVLPYLGNLLNITKTKLTKVVHKNLKFSLFKTTNKFDNYFCLKDIVPEALRSNRVYKFSCVSCTAFYIHKIYRYMKVRVSKHQGVSLRTGKTVQGTLSTSVRDRMLIFDHHVAWEDFRIFVSKSNKE